MTSRLCSITSSEPPDSSSRRWSKPCSRPTQRGSKGSATPSRRPKAAPRHITAIDREGGIAALTTTLLSSFGSRYVLPQTGILMNNGVMWFDPRPGRPNSIGPGKRALTNMCPLIVARDGRPRFGVGASGGRRILAAVLQMASFVVDFGMSPEEAAHHPRIDVSGADGVAIDRRLPEAVIDRLSEPRPARMSSSTRSGRSNSPAPTWCCAARTASITASPT